MEPEKKSFDNTTIDYFKNQIQSLTQKLTIAEGKVHELEEIQKQLSTSEKNRVDLTVCIKESSDKILNDNKNITDFKEKLIEKEKNIISENQSLKEKLNTVSNNKNELESYLNKVDKIINILKSDINILQANKTNEDAMAKLLVSINELFKVTKNNKDTVRDYNK